MNCLVIQFGICLGVVVILWLNVMKVFSGGVLLDRPCMVFQKKSLRAGSQVFTLLMLFLCVILHNMWSGKSLQLLCASCPLVCWPCVWWSERKQTLCHP